MCVCVFLFEVVEVEFVFWFCGWLNSLKYLAGVFVMLLVDTRSDLRFFEKWWKSDLWLLVGFTAEDGLVGVERIRGSFLLFARIMTCTTIYKVYNYTPKTKYDNGKTPLLIGNTSSKGCFSIVMLVFGGVQLTYIYIYIYM